MKLFAKQLEAARKKREEAVKKLEGLVTAAEGEDRALTDDEQKTFETLRQEITDIDGRIKTLEASEALVGSESRAVVPRQQDDTAPDYTAALQAAERAAAEIVVPQGFALIKTNTQRPKIKGAFFAKQAHLLYIAGGNAMVAAEYAKSMGDKEMAMVLRAATTGADSSTSAWAGTLVQQEMQDFIDLLRPKSVFARVAAGTTMTFDTTNNIKIPRVSTGTPGGFVAEGGAIPVKTGAFNSITLTPSKLGVITVATREVLARSTPALETLLRDMMLRDTAITLDRRFFCATAAGSGAPDGLLHANNAAAPITASATGNAADDAIADIKAIMQAMYTNNIPMDGMVWLMHPSKKLDLMALRQATGTFYFRDELIGGTLQGMPVLDSAVLDKGVNDGGATNIKTIALMDASLLVKANGIAPTIALSTEAMLHMDDAPNADILVPASGGKSLFQTDSVALRLTWETTWKTRLVNAVQYINNVTW